MDQTMQILHSLAAMNCGTVRHHVHVACSPGTMLHPLFQCRLRAATLSAIVLVLASRILFTQLPSTSRELCKPEQAVVHLICDGQKPRIIHVREMCLDGIKIVSKKEFGSVSHTVN